MFTRRQFLASVAAPIAVRHPTFGRRSRGSAPVTGLAAPRTPEDYPPLPAIDLAAAGRQLRQRFPDLRNHFIFEYTPGYRTESLAPLESVGSCSALRHCGHGCSGAGRLRSRDTHVLEQHARWIVESGAGAIDVSWWGRGGYEDQSVPLLMDVMRDYGLKVTFHLEPVQTTRGSTRYASRHPVPAHRVR